IVLGGTTSNRTVTLRPTTNQFGNTTVTLTVRDPEGLTANSSFVLTVTNINDPPSLGPIANQTTLEDTVLSLALSLADIDTAGSNLVLSASSTNQSLMPNTNLVFTGTDFVRTLQITPATNQFGTSSITVTLSDGSASVSQSFLLTVVAVNDPPTLNPISDVITNEDAGLLTVALSGITSGATNESQALTVTAISSNPGLIPNPAITYTSPNATGSLSFTPVTNANGTATIT